MKPLLAPVLLAGNPLCQQVYQTLLRRRDRDWTVADMAAVLPSVPVNDLRITLHVLLGERLVDIASGGHRLAMRLNDDGARILAELLGDGGAGS